MPASRYPPYIGLPPLVLPMIPYPFHTPFWPINTSQSGGTTSSADVGSNAFNNPAPKAKVTNVGTSGTIPNITMGVGGTSSNSNSANAFSKPVPKARATNVGTSGTIPNITIGGTVSDNNTAPHNKGKTGTLMPSTGAVKKTSATKGDGTKSSIPASQSTAAGTQQAPQRPLLLAKVVAAAKTLVVSMNINQARNFQRHS